MQAMSAVKVSQLRRRNASKKEISSVSMKPSNRLFEGPTQQPVIFLRKAIFVPQIHWYSVLSINAKLGSNLVKATNQMMLLAQHLKASELLYFSFFEIQHLLQRQKMILLFLNMSLAFQLSYRHYRLQVIFESFPRVFMINIRPDSSAYQPHEPPQCRCALLDVLRLLLNRLFQYAIDG